METPTFNPKLMISTCVIVLLIVCYTLVNVLINDATKYPLNDSLVDLNEIYHHRSESVPNRTIVIYNPPLYWNFEANNKYFSQCQFSNCRITFNRSNMHLHSAIVFVLTEALPLPEEPPLSPSERNADQVWIFYWQEPPARHRVYGLNYRNENWRGTVNWTMSYTRDAEVQAPYGALRKRIPPARMYSEIFYRKRKMVAWVVSNCEAQSRRMEFVSKLRNQGIEVDMFGKCAGKRVEAGEIQELISQAYMFYLSFENSLCKDYITEKFFTYMQLDVILVTRGGGNYSNFLPNTAYVNTADFSSVKYLADHLKSLASNETLYSKYLKEKDKYEVVDDNTMQHDNHCKWCEKLNNLDDNRHIYRDYRDYVDNCLEPNDLRSRSK